jgi:hypothetical protein
MKKDLYTNDEVNNIALDAHTRLSRNVQAMIYEKINTTYSESIKKELEDVKNHIRNYCLYERYFWEENDNND